MNDELIENIHDAEYVEELIDQGADPNYDNLFPGGSNPPLHVAIMRGYLSTAKSLIDRGADVNKTNGDQMTPLHQIILHRDRGDMWMDIGIVDLLIRKGADINLRNSQGKTPLEYALSMPNSDSLLQQIIQILEETERTNAETRNVRRRLSFGGGSMTNDHGLGRTIELMFAKMSDMNMKSATLEKLKKRI